MTDSEMKMELLKDKGYSESKAAAMSMRGPKDDGLVDMRKPKKTKEQIKKESMVSPYEGERYPYGLRIDLEDEVMKKLGMDLPTVGKTMTLKAKVMVERAESRESNDGKRLSCCLQITRMKVV